MDDLLPEKKCSNTNTTTRTSYGSGVCTNSSASNVTVMSKPLSKTNATSIISQQPSNLAANGNSVEVTTSARKNSSGNSYIENELKVNNYLIKSK